MTAAPARWGLAGTGFWSSIARELAQKWDRISVERVWSRRIENARRLAVELSAIGKRECRAVGNWTDLQGLDGVIIALPPSEMPAVVRFARENRIPAIIEKPVALDRNAVAELQDATGSAASRVAVHMQGRFVPAMHALRSLATGGKYGRVREVAVHSLGNWNHPDAPTAHSWKHDRAAGGGILGVSGPHASEFVFHVLGAGRSRFLRTWTEVLERKDDGGVPRRCSAEDNAVIIREHDQDVLSFMRLSSTARKREEVWTVRCANGTLRMTAEGTLVLLGNDGANERVDGSREDVLRSHGIAPEEPFTTVSDHAFPSMVFLELFLREPGVADDLSLPDLRTMLTCWTMLGEVAAT